MFEKPPGTESRTLPGPFGNTSICHAFSIFSLETGFTVHLQILKYSPTYPPIDQTPLSPMAPVGRGSAQGLSVAPSSTLGPSSCEEKHFLSDKQKKNLHPIRFRPSKNDHGVVWRYGKYAGKTYESSEPETLEQSMFPTLGFLEKPLHHGIHPKWSQETPTASKLILSGPWMLENKFEHNTTSSRNM